LNASVFRNRLTAHDLKQEYPSPFRDVFELGGTEIAYLEVEPRLDLTIGVFRKADRARLGDTLSRAAIFTPSPMRSPSLSSTTSPT
jgi:hypothetical protein